MLLDLSLQPNSLIMRPPAGIIAEIPSALGPDLLAWWDPSDLSTLFQEAAGTTPVAAENDPVGLMRDKSGNGRHFSTTATPAWQADGSLLFNGTSHFMNLESQPFPSGANPCEMWAVVRQDALAADATNRTILAYGTGLSTGGRNLRRVVSGGVNRLQVATGDGVGTSTAAETTVDFSGAHVVVARVTATASHVEIDGTAGTPTSVVPSTGTLRVRLGGTTATTPVAFWSGKIGPVMITGPLSAAQRVAMQAYFDSITLT